MTISRKQYITVAELNEILNATYDDNADTLQLIYEASEMIAYHTMDKSDYVTDETQLNLLKLATAYQVDYLNDNEYIDSDYGNAGASLGRYSTGQASSGSEEWKKIAPKCNRYLNMANLLYRGADVSMRGYYD